MLNDKSRHGLSHLPAAQKWSAFTAGSVIRLPRSEIRGGWGSGWHDWFPWRIVSFNLHGDTATIQSLSDSRAATTIPRRTLEMIEEIAPFGTTLRSHNLPDAARFNRAKPKKRYA